MYITYNGLKIIQSTALRAVVEIKSDFIARTICGELDANYCDSNRDICAVCIPILEELDVAGILTEMHLVGRYFILTSMKNVVIKQLYMPVACKVTREQLQTFFPGVDLIET